MSRRGLNTGPNWRVVGSGYPAGAGAIGRDATRIGSHPWFTLLPKRETRPLNKPADTVRRFKSAAPAGAAALAIVVAVVGGTVLMRRASDAPVTTAFEQTIPATPSSVSPMPPAPLAVGAVGASPPGLNPGPALPGIQFDQAGASAGKLALGGEIVVKFRDDRKVQDLVDTFWKDAPGARKKFEAFKAGRPEFAGVKLDRVTYSNELVLTPIANVAPDKRAAQVRDLAAKMGKAADISYAEANVTAKPGDR